jgi:nicotinamide-nucleotide amidase
VIQKTPTHFNNHKVSVIAIGTEITTGEIINRNAAWLSERCSNFGFTVTLHLTVPDDRELIQTALKHASEVSGIILVTGGLGPTTDDFTREEIAKFCNQPLIWSESAWADVVRRLNSVGAPIAESNRQQCYFPKDSRILANSQGTAAAFSLTKLVEPSRKIELFVLPGPPNEIEAIWGIHLEKTLKDRVPLEHRQSLHKFICLGLSESKLGELAEAALENSGYATGYRARVPYIDFKVWTTPDNESDFQEVWKQKIIAALHPFIVGEDDFDAAKHCLSKLPRHHSILLIDHATSGLLANRCLQQSHVQNLPFKFICEHSPKKGDDSSSALPSNYSETILLKSDLVTGEWSLIRRFKDQENSFHEKSRYKGIKNRERFEAYVCEKALCILANFWQTKPQ